MDVVDTVCAESTLPESVRAYSRDSLTLGWEERLHVHGRRRSDGGVEFGTSLPRGTMLRGGDCLLLESVRVVVVVVEKAEPVFVIEPSTPREWGLFAYHIGNRHQPLMVTERALVCPDVAGMEQLLRQQHIPYVRATQPFTPATGAATHRHD